MNENNITILTTRELANNIMIKAEQSGVKIDTVSFIETRSIIDPAISEKIRKYIPEDINVAFTSMNAAEAVIDCLEYNNAVPDWTVYSLGGITGSITSNFFEQGNVIANAQNAKQLAEEIIEDGVKEVIFFCGNQRREDLPQALRLNNITVTEIMVYETIDTPVKIDKNYSGILFFSPSAAKSFFSINKVAPSSILFAIGATTANALKELCSNKILVGSHPNKEQLAEQAITYLTK